MAFLKEKVYAFIDTPIERKRSDHRLKSVDSVTDARSWVLDEELKRQHFFKVVNRGLQGTGGREGTRGERLPLQPPGGDAQEVRQPTASAPQPATSADETQAVKSDQEPRVQKISADTHRNLNVTDLPPDSQSLPDGRDSIHLTDAPSTSGIPRDRQPMHFTDVPGALSSPGDESLNVSDEPPVSSSPDDRQPMHFTQAQTSARGPQDEGLRPLNVDDFGVTQTANFKDDTFKPKYKNMYLDGNNEYLRNIIADKENEIERLLYRINAMAEAGIDSNKTVMLELKLKEKEEELTKNKKILRNTENMLQNLQNLLESTSEDPSKQKEHMDKLMEGLQSDMPSDIEGIDYTIRNLEDRLKNADEEIALLKKELEAANAQVNALLSGDENGLNKIIDDLRNELKNSKAEKDAENKGLRDQIAQKEKEIKEMKDNFKGLVKGTDISPKDELTKKAKEHDPESEAESEIDRLINEIDHLKKDLQNEKDKVSKLTSADDNDLKRMIGDLEKENNKLKEEKELCNKQLKSQQDEIDQFKKSLQSAPDDKNVSNQLEERLKELESLLNNEKEQNKNLKKDLQTEKDKVGKLTSADDNDLKRMIGDLEKENNKLKEEKELDNKLLKSKQDDIDKLKKSLQSAPDDTNISNKLQESLKELESLLNNEKEQNKNLKKDLQNEKDKVSKLTSADDNDLKRMIGDLEKENNKLKEEKELCNKQLKSQQDEIDQFKKSLQSAPDDKNVSNQLEERLKELESLLNNEKEQNQNLKKDLQNEKDKVIKLTSADENDLKRMLGNLEKENNKLKEEKELDNKKLKSQQNEIDQFKNSPKSAPDDKYVSNELEERVKELESLLNNEKDQNNNLKKDLQNEKDKFIALASANDNDLKKMLADAEKEIKHLTGERDKLKGVMERSNQSPLEDITGGPKLNQELEQLKKENKTLKDEIAKLKKESLGQKQILTEKPMQETNIGDIIEKNKELEKENADLRKQNDSLNNTIRMIAPERGPVDQVVLKSENDRLRYELKDETDKRKILAHEAESLKSKNDKLENELRKLLQLREGLSDNDPEALRNKILKLEKEKNDLELRSQPDSFQIELKNTLQKRNKIKDLEDNLQKQDDPDGFIDELKSTINELDEENKKLREINKNLEKSVKDEKDKCNEAISNKDKNIEKLQAEIKQLKDSLLGESRDGDDSANKHDPDVCDKEKQSLKGEIDKLKERITSTAKDPKVDDKTKVKLEEENTKLKDELNDLKGKIDSYKHLEDEKMKLKKENDALKSQLKSLSDKLGETSVKPDTTAVGNELLNENKKLKSQLDDVNDKLKQFELSRDQGKLEGNKVSSKLEDENKTLRQKVVEFENKTKSSDNDVSKLLEDNKGLKSDNAKLVKELDNLKKELEVKSFPKDETDYVSEINNLKDENKKLKEKIKANEYKGADSKIQTPTGTTISDAPNKYEKENNDLKNEINTLKDKIKSLEGEINKARGKGPTQVSNELNDDNNILKEKVKALEDEIKKMHSMSQKELGNDLLKNENDKLKEKIRMLEDQITNLNKKSTGIDNKEKSPEAQLNNINKLRDENEKLVKENKYLKGEIDKMKANDSDLKEKTQGIKVKDVKAPNNLTEQINTVELENKGLKSKLFDLEKSLKNAQKASLDCENDKKKLMDLIKKAEEAGGLSDNELINMYKQDINKLNNDKKKLKDDLISKDAELNNLRDTNNKLNKSLEDLKASAKAIDQPSPNARSPTDQETSVKPTRSIDKKTDTKKVLQGGSERDQSKIIPEINRLNEELYEKNNVIKDLKKKLEEEIKSNNLLRDQLNKFKKLDDLKMIAGEKLKNINSEPFDDSVLSPKKNEDLMKNIKKVEKYKPTSPSEKSVEIMDKEETKPSSKRKSKGFSRKDKKPSRPDNKLGDSDDEKNHVYQMSPKKSGRKSGSLEQIDSDELKNLKKKLNEAEQEIDSLRKENTQLKTENNELRKNINLSALEDKGGDLNKYLDEDTKRLNQILQKAIRSGMKSLFIVELDYVHAVLNKTMGERNGPVQTSGRHSSEEYENMIRILQGNINSLMSRLDNFREHSSQQDRKLTDYSQKVQRLNIDVGRYNMDNHSLHHKNKQLREMISYEKAKAKQLEEILQSVLETCKCTKRDPYTMCIQYLQNEGDICK